MTEIDAHPTLCKRSRTDPVLEQILDYKNQDAFQQAMHSPFSDRTRVYRMEMCRIRDINRWSSRQYFLYPPTDKHSTLITTFPPD